MAHTYLPLITEKAAEFFASNNRNNIAKAIMAHSANIVQANDTFRRRGYTLQLRKRYLATYKNYLNNQAMTNIPKSPEPGFENKSYLEELNHVEKRSLEEFIGMVPDVGVPSTLRDIDLSSTALDSRITYTGASYPYLGVNGHTSFSGENVWAVEYDGSGISGKALGRNLPNIANENMIVSAIAATTDSNGKGLVVRPNTFLATQALDANGFDLREIVDASPQIHQIFISNLSRPALEVGKRVGVFMTYSPVNVTRFTIHVTTSGTGAINAVANMGTDGSIKVITAHPDITFVNDNSCPGFWIVPTTAKSAGANGLAVGITIVGDDNDTFNTATVGDASRGFDNFGLWMVQKDTGNAEHIVPFHWNATSTDIRPASVATINEPGASKATIHMQSGRTIDLTPVNGVFTIPNMDYDWLTDVATKITFTK